MVPKQAKAFYENASLNAAAFSFFDIKKINH